MGQSMRRVAWQLIVVVALINVAGAFTASAQTRGGFDASGRLLMHGTPRFMLGVYDSGGSYSPDPALWEQQIFSPTGDRGLQGFPLNLYLNYWMGGMPIGPTNALLDVLQTHGMMYLQTGNCFADGSWTRYGPGSFSIMSQTYVQQYAQHPAALGYYIMDECDDALIPETQQHQQQLKTWDPQGVTFAATLAAGYRDPSLWVNAADVLGVDPYPLYGPEPSVGYTHFIVADFASKLRAVAKPTRPIWMVLQFFKFTSDSRLPTPEEMRAHAVMSIVEGAQGIFWWDIGVNGLRQLDATTVSTYMGHLKTLTTELAGLEPALLADPAPGALIGNSSKFADPVAGRIGQLQHNISVEWLYSRIQWYQAELAALQAGNTSKSGGMLNGAANVRTLTKVVNGVGYVFAYNYTNLPQPATFTWNTAPTSVRESKSGQTFALNGASWSDTFAPYQSRIYVVNGAGAPPPPPPPDLTLSFTNPASGATVSGTTTVSVVASGGTGYSYTIKVDGTTISTGTSGSVGWNTTTVANGTHTLTATVTDAQSRTATASRTVTVSNTANPPPGGFTVTFSYPVSGATVSGAQSVGLSTTATWGQAKTFALSVDGVSLISQGDTGTTLWYTWDTTTIGNGSHTLSASVTMAGQTAIATLPVVVGNAGAPPGPALSATFTSPAAGARVKGMTMVGMASSGASGASTFKLAVDGTVVSTQTINGATATYAWNTAAASPGARTLTLTVTDGTARTATATRTVVVGGGAATVGDFDGDGRADLALYRPATAEWFVLGSATGFRTLVFGAPAASGLGDTPVPGDYDGDGQTDLAVYRKATGEWFIFGSATGSQTRVFGAPAASGLGDTPVPGDYDGDGKADLAVYRKATGEWFIFGSATGSQTRVFGAPAASGLGDVAVPADYDGDGKVDMAIYRQATGEWFIFGSATGFQTRVFGAPAASGLGDVPMPADYDGDGQADMAIYRQATGEWFIFGSATGFQPGSLGSAAATDLPLAVDFDGDGKADTGVFRAAISQWSILRSADGQTQNTTWGAPTDLPLPQPATRR
jgi:hypothetical protein